MNQTLTPRRTSPEEKKALHDFLSGIIVGTFCGKNTCHNDLERVILDMVMSPNKASPEGTEMGKKANKPRVEVPQEFIDSFKGPHAANGATPREEVITPTPTLPAETKQLKESPYDLAASKSDAIRKIYRALKDGGNPRPMPRDVLPLYQATKWASGKDATDTGLVSQVLYAVRLEDGGASSSKGPSPASLEPTIADVLKVHQLLAERGQSPQELEDYLAEAEGLARVVGSPEKLRKCLEGLRQIKEG